MVQTKLFLVSVLSFIIFTQVNAASFSNAEVFPNTLAVEGEFIKGDFDKFLAFYNQMSHPSKFDGRKIYPQAVMLNSPGGDLKEALQIAEFIETMKLRIIMNGECNSACVFVLFAAPHRTYCCQIGLHRPYFNREFFADLSLEDAEKEYNKLLKESKQWLIDRYVPQEIIDGLINASSFEAKYIGYKDLKILVGEKSPAYEEWTAARCGYLTEEEEADFNVAYLNDLFEKNGNSMYRDDSDDYNTWIDRQVLMASMMSAGYRKYLLEKHYEVGTCTYRELQEHRRSILGLSAP